MSDAIAAHLLTHFLLSLVENTCRRRNWQPEMRREGKWQVLAAVSAVFAKSQSFPQGTWLSLKQTRKELMSALIRTRLNIDGELQSVAFVPKSEGGIIAAPVWNLHELQLLTKRPHKAQENPLLHSALVPLTSTGADRPIIEMKCMQT